MIGYVVDSKLHYVNMFFASKRGEKCFANLYGYGEGIHITYMS